MITPNGALKLLSNIKSNVKEIDLSDNKIGLIGIKCINRMLISH